MNARNWQDDAACRDIGIGLFVADDRDGVAVNNFSYREGKKICAGCPVARACLADAMAREGGASHEYRAGLYGGLTPIERSKLAWHQSAQRRAAA
jgi:hypothetical protein